MRPSSAIPGEITTFCQAVGHRRAEGGQASVDIVKLLGPDMVVETFDDDTYWGFESQGAELLWRDQVLISATFFVAGDPDNGYRPYPRRLFDAFDNRADVAQVITALGSPSVTGGPGHDWIRYDELVEGTRLHFQFTEGQLWSVTVMAAEWQR